MYCDASKESSAKTFTIPIPESYYSYVGNIRRDSIGHILMYLASWLVTSAMLGTSLPPRAGGLASGSSASVPAALVTRAVLAGDGGSTEIASAKSILADEGNVQLPSKAQRTGTAAVSHGRFSCRACTIKAWQWIGMSLLATLATFGLALGIVVFIELLEIEALGLGVDPLVTAPDVVMMVTVVVLVISLVVLLDLVRSLLLTELRLDGLECPREETWHNIFRMILEALPETGHLEQTADATRFASEDVIQHGSLAKDGELIAGALLLCIAQGEGIED